MRAAWIISGIAAIAAIPPAASLGPTGRAEEPLAATYVDKASAPVATDAPPPHAEDIVDYTLTARLDPILHVLHGEGTIRWRNTSRVRVREIWVHLYLNAFKNELSTYMREPVGHSRGTLPVRDWGSIDVRRFALRGAGGSEDLWKDAELHRPGDTDETDARVPLPRDVEPGDSIEIEVAWDDKVPSVVERTGFVGSFHMLGQWFPKVARLEPDGRWAHFPMHHLAEFYADFGTYDVTIDVPSSFVVGATGPAVESRIEDGRRLERHVQTDIHDFAFTAYDDFDERRERVGGVDVRVLFPHGATVDAERELATVRFGLPHFAALYGPYPYDVLTLVHPPPGAEEAGGMEYPTLITTGGDYYWPPFSRGIELVTMHEFGHQYFYGLLATDEVLWPFLDEGLNSYAEAEALRAAFGSGSVVSFLGFSLSDTAVQSVFGNRLEHDEAVAQAAYDFHTGDAYADLVYERTASIVETLRRVYGERVTAALGLYARRYRFQHPGPEELIACFESEVGAEAAATLRAALFGKGWVDYAVTSLASKRAEAPAGLFDKNGSRESAPAGVPVGSSYEGWVLVTRRGTLSFPVDVELALEDGTVRRLRWSGEESAIRLPYKGPSALTAAIVDPAHNVLLDDDPTNNHGAVSPAPRAPRVAERLTYWAELLLQALGP